MKYILILLLLPILTNAQTKLAEVKVIKQYKAQKVINVKAGTTYQYIVGDDTSRHFIPTPGKNIRAKITFEEVGTVPPVEEPEQPVPNTGKIGFKIDNGVRLTNVDGTNPVLYDNDFWGDTPDDDLLNHLHSKGLVKLVGHVITHNPDAYFTNAKLVSYANRDMVKLANTPALIMGASAKLVRPANGSIDSTVPQNGPGVDLIIAQARKATPSKPLVIFVGGQCTSVASAYLKDKSIADRVIVLQTAGYWNKPNVVQSYNTGDPWSAYVVMKRMKYISANFSFAGPHPNKYWYKLQNVGLTKAMVDALPSTAINNAVKKWYTERFSIEYMSDSCPVLWFFNNSLWRNVERKKENGAIVTGNDYDFLQVSDHNWAGYGPELIKQLKR